MSTSNRKERIKRLERHLRDENPPLAEILPSYRQLDKLAQRLGVLGANESYTDAVSWWPVISILGTYSAGKSTFLNQCVGQDLQRAGNQAVDDKFTVVCYGENDGTVLPGSALDADPRLPFFRISADIDEVAGGEGRRVDSYRQLKTSGSEWLRGKIVIDSPGFDADEQRSSTLLITDHIIDLSDLVLVFFDARRPEPGTMGDTLDHLVSKTVSRSDANKFLYVLNQIDMTAKEDNAEEVVAAWQRALAQHGLTAGRFYRIYAREATPLTDNDQARERLERKRDEDLAEIESRIDQVEVGRAYRIAGELEKNAKFLRDEVVPELQHARSLWKRRTLWLSLAAFGTLLAAFLAWSIAGGHWQGFTLTPLASLDDLMQIVVAGLGIAAAAYLYMWLRRLAGKAVARALDKKLDDGPKRDAVLRGFDRNRKAWWRSLAPKRPKGWSRRTQRQLDTLLKQTNEFVQRLNDRYARPSGAGENK